MQNANMEKREVKYSKKMSSCNMYVLLSEDSSALLNMLSFFFLQHIKNIHKDKTFQCSDCDEKFAFEWQLKYHRKYCGTELKCRTCGKRYAKPMSLLMHCKRTLHSPPVEQQFKSVKKSLPVSATIVYVPIFIDSTSLLQNRPILPMPALVHSTSTLPSLNLNQLPSCKTVKKSHSSHNRKTENARITQFTNRRSTDCQTVRKKNRAHSKLSVKSIETQTVASSFDVPQSSKTYLDHEGELNAKCSSFTQTFFDDIGEGQGEPVMRDTFLSTSEESHFETAAQNQYSFGNGIYSNIETQTQASMADFGDPDMNMVADGDDFQISDLELIDIETQTIWNYDRTTQTDGTSSLDTDWLMNL